MRFKLGLIAFLLVTGCAKSEKLDDDEMQYVKTTLAITKARVESHDSVQLVTKLDSVYKKFGTSKDGYKNQTVKLGEDPARVGIIFRVIADSMNVK